MNHYNCIFTGGSTRGLCYIGVLKALEELDIKIDAYAGSSIGALILTFYALGYTAKEIEEETDKLNLWSLFVDINPNFIFDFGLSKGNKYYKWLKNKIESKFYGNDYKKGEMKPVCFKDIKADLIITATNVETSEMEIFSKETTPDMEIALALRITTSIPGLLKPVLYQGKTLTDGDILRARPIWKTVKRLTANPKQLIEFRITGGNRNKISKNPVKLVNGIVNAAAYTIDNDAVNTYKDYINIIQININDLLFTDFNLSKDRKKSIYDIGYKTTMTYFYNKAYYKN